MTVQAQRNADVQKQINGRLVKIVESLASVCNNLYQELTLVKFSLAQLQKQLPLLGGTKCGIQWGYPSSPHVCGKPRGHMGVHLCSKSRSQRHREDNLRRRGITKGKCKATRSLHWRDLV